MLEKFLIPIPALHDERMISMRMRSVESPLGLEDYLERQGLDVIVVAIDRHALNEERVNEYCPWVNGEYNQKILGYVSTQGGKGEAYVDFIVQEWKSHIDSTYHTLVDRSYMAGISLGGLISTYAACRYPRGKERPSPSTVEGLFDHQGADVSIGSPVF